MSDNSDNNVDKNDPTNGPAKDGDQKPSRPETLPVAAAAKPKKAATAAGVRRLPLTAILALALGVVLAAVSYLNFSRWQATDAQTQSLAGENTMLRGRVNELQQQISGLQRQDLDANLAVQQLRSDQQLQNGTLNQLGQQLQALAADKGKDPMLWRLAEVEFLLAVANQRLALERDVNTALIALQDADRRLEAIGDPALLAIRKSIANEVTALKSVDMPDVPGMALRLSSLTGGIEQLPLVNRERVQAELAMDDSVVNDMNELLAKILQDLKGVVTVRRSGEPIEPLLPPEEQHYLAQNLALKLEEARIALLHLDTAALRQHLSDTRQWVQRYFDPNAAAVGNVLATVDDLLAVELKPELPDISGSLRELRRWLKAQQQARGGSDSSATP